MFHFITQFFQQGGDTFRQEEKDKIINKIKNTTEEEAVRDFEHLKILDLSKISDETRIGNKFVDHFTFGERLETISKKGMSYFDFVQNTEYHKKKYIQNLLNYQKGEDKHVALYRVFKLHCGSIGIFKPVTAMEVYRRFNPQSVLDMTMGWGGRLVGACAIGVPNYIGIDSNVKLKEPYANMVKLLKKQKVATKIKLMFKDALKVDYSKLDYDMVLTSPPYYNIEVYEGMETASNEEWETHFYIPLFSETYKHLKRGGHYVLNVPTELYEKVCIPLFGKAGIKMPLKVKRNRPKNGYTKKGYSEYIYVWQK